MVRTYLFISIACIIQASRAELKEDVFAVLLSTSKFWFNYRQSTNILSVYNQLKKNGIPDSNVLRQYSRVSLKIYYF